MTAIAASGSTACLTQLLAAASRGARIECKYTQDPGDGKKKTTRWVVTSMVCVNRDSSDYRIHPDDEKLRFGALSLYFFNAADEAKRSLQIAKASPLLLQKYVSEHDQQVYSNCRNRLLRGTYLLSLAEALSHDGL